MTKRYERVRQTGVGGGMTGRYIKTYNPGGENFIKTKEQVHFIDRSRPWPIDEFAIEQEQRRKAFIRDFWIGIVIGIVFAYPPVYLVLTLTGHVR